jgi:hypothetical protein
VAQPQFPLWAFIAEMAAIPATWVFVWLLARRLRALYPQTWEQLGRPTGSSFAAYPGKIMAASEAALANLRLVVFPLRIKSFERTDLGTAILIWLIRTVLVGW